MKKTIEEISVEVGELLKDAHESGFHAIFAMMDTTSDAIFTSTACSVQSGVLMAAEMIHQVKNFAKTGETPNETQHEQTAADIDPGELP